MKKWYFAFLQHLKKAGTRQNMPAKKNWKSLEKNRFWVNPTKLFTAVIYGFS
jgi:hypothetical protein